jgi:hypothetical protein
VTAPNPYFYVLDRPLSRPQVIDELAAMPSRLRAAIERAPSPALTRAPAPGEWSAFQTLLHLRDATLVYAIRFRFIAFNDDPLLPNYDEEAWVARAGDTVDDVPAILDEIAASRSDLVRVLSRLPDEAWSREGRHEVAGPIVLEHYARHQVVHEAMHLDQFEAAFQVAR